MEGSLTQNIISGRLKYGRVRKDDDYGINRNAEVELSFTVNAEDDAEAVIDRAGKLAMRKAHEFLGLQSSTAISTGTVAVETTPAAVSDKEKLAAAVVKPPRAPRTTKPKASADPAEVSDPAAVQAEPAATTAKSDPADMAEDWTAAAPEITDVDLTGACSRTAKAIGDAQPIRLLIAEFAGPPPKQLREIPQAMRAQFMHRLAALTEKK